MGIRNWWDSSGRGLVSVLVPTLLGIAAAGVGLTGMFALHGPPPKAYRQQFLNSCYSLASGALLFIVVGSCVAAIMPLLLRLHRRISGLDTPSHDEVAKERPSTWAIVLALTSVPAAAVWMFREDPELRYQAPRVYHWYLQSTPKDFTSDYLEVLNVVAIEMRLRGEGVPIVGPGSTLSPREQLLAVYGMRVAEARADFRRGAIQDAIFEEGFPDVARVVRETDKAVGIVDWDKKVLEDRVALIATDFMDLGFSSQELDVPEDIAKRLPLAPGDLEFIRSDYKYIPRDDY